MPSWSRNARRFHNDVRLSVVDGFRNGVWADTIMIDRPEIQLHFDQQGNLITNLPASPSNEQDAAPIEKLPFRTVQVKNARFAVRGVDAPEDDLRGLALGGRLCGGQQQQSGADQRDPASAEISVAARNSNSHGFGFFRTECPQAQVPA